MTNFSNVFSWRKKPLSVAYMHVHQIILVARPMIPVVDHIIRDETIMNADLYLACCDCNYHKYCDKGQKSLFLMLLLLVVNEARVEKSFTK